MKEEKTPREDPRKEIESPEPPEAEPLPDQAVEDAAGGLGFAPRFPKTPPGPSA